MRMDLAIDKSVTMQFEGHIDVELPGYMVLLPPDELAEARSTDTKHQLVLAAGRHPETDDIIILLNSGELIEVRNTNMKGIPLGDVRPIDCGLTIAVTRTGHVKGDFEIASSYAISEGHTLVSTVKNEPHT